MFNLIPLPYKIGAAALLLLAVAGFGYSKGAESVQEDWGAQKAADAVALEKVKTKQADISAKVDEATQTDLAKTRIIYKTITREVPIYVSQKDDAACSINHGFVRLHDAAAQGILPPPPGDTDAGASGVALSTAAGTITENYGTCTEIRKTLMALQKWEREQDSLRRNGK